MSNQPRKGSKLPNTLIPEMFERRPFAVRALTVLLIIQAVALSTIALFAIDWRNPLLTVVWQYATELAYLVMALLNLISAVGFIRYRPAAWLVSMFTQGLFLLMALVDYLVNRPDNYTYYLLMALSVLIVVYLNYAEVPALFLRWRSPQADNRPSGPDLDTYDDYAEVES